MWDRESVFGSHCEVFIERRVTSILSIALLMFWPFAGEAQQNPSATAAGKADVKDIEALRERLVELQNQLKQIQGVLGDLAGREPRREDVLKPVPSVAVGDGDADRWREAQKAYDEGSRAEDQHQFAAAIGHFTRAVQLDPGNDSAFLHRGSCYFEIGNSARALADFSESLRLQPNNSRSYQLRADAYYAEGKYAEAIGDLDQAIRRNQQNVATYAQRARAYRSLGQNERALDDCRKAVTLAPRFERGLICRAMALIALGRESEALPDLKTVLELNPESSEAKALIAQSGERPATAHAPVMVAGVQPGVAPVAEKPVLVASAKPQVQSGAPGVVAGVQPGVAPVAEKPVLVASAKPQVQSGAPGAVAAVQPGVAPVAEKPVMVASAKPQVQSGAPAVVAGVQPAPLPIRAIPVQAAAVLTPAVERPAIHEADRMVIRAVANAIKPVLAPTRRVSPEQRRQADAFVAKARMRVNRGEYRGSVDLLDQAIQLDPRSALAYNSRGYAHLRLKEYPLAIADFTVAIELKEGYANAQHNLEVARKLSGVPEVRSEQQIAASTDAEDVDFGGPDHE